jgi:hypothetical protein
MNTLRPILFSLVFLLGTPAWAAQGKEAKTEAATSAATATAQVSQSTSKATFDDKVIREADDRVRRSEGELTYLGAAYLAAFLILAVFLFSTRKSQQRLADEVKELQDRVDDALRANAGTDA